MARLNGDESSSASSGAPSRWRTLKRSLTAWALPACFALATGTLAAAPDVQEDQAPAIPAETSTAIDDEAIPAASDHGDSLAQNDRRKRRGPRGDFVPPARRERSDRGPRDFSDRDSGRRGPPRFADRSWRGRDRRPAPEFAQGRGPRHFGPPGGQGREHFDHRGGPPHRGYGHYHHARYEGPRGGWGPHGPPHRGQSSEEVVQLLHDLRSEVAQLRREIHALRASAGSSPAGRSSGSSSSTSSGSSGGSSSGSTSSGSSGSSSGAGFSPRGMGGPGRDRGDGRGFGPRGFRGPPGGRRAPAEMQDPRREDSGREGPGRDNPRGEPRRPEGPPQRGPGADGPPRTGLNDTPAVREENPAQPVVTELVTPAESIPAQED